MPQFQILDQAPSFANQLAGQLGAGVGQGLQQGLAQFHKGKQFEKAGLPKEWANIDPRLLGALLKQKQNQDLMSAIFGGPPEFEFNEEETFPSEDEEEIEEKVEETPYEESFEKPSPPKRTYTPEQIQAISIQNPALGKVLQDQNKIDRQEQLENKKRNIKVFDKANDDIRGIDEQFQDITRLGNLSEKIGKKQEQDFFSRLARTYRFDPETRGFTKIGRATSTPEEEEYIKTISNLTKNIKNDFGARVTNLDLSVFLSRFPDLMTTPDGRKMIIDTIKDYLQAKRLYSQALKNELTKSKGTIDPYDLESIVEKKIQKPLGEIRSRMANRGLSSETENKFAEEGKIYINKNGQRIKLVEGKWQTIK